MSLRIAYINYHNTAAYNFAFNHLLVDQSYTIIDEVPAKCAELFNENNVDVALVPVGTLKELSDYSILPNFGIACDGAVRTVCLFANQSIENIHTIVLDPHSRTSNALIRILCNEYWQIQPSFVMGDYDKELSDGEGRVSIGDKVFKHESKYAIKYDLGQYWKAFTNLPFVFAVWVKRNNLEEGVEQDMLDAFGQALNDPEAWLPDHSHKISGLRAYLTEHIKFRINEDMQKSLKVFLNKI